MSEVKIKVELISHTYDPEQTCVAAIRQCYSKIGAKELKEKTDKETKKRLLRQIIASDHTSTIEHASFTFAIEGISRACSHQLVRHRIASYSQQSQRYVKPGEEINYIVPPKIKNNPQAKEIFEKTMKSLSQTYQKLVDLGTEKEDARFVLPNAFETKIVVTMNARALLHFFEKRLCNRAQWEIHQLAFKMLQLVKKVAPKIFQYAGPTCETEKICWEGKMACPKWKIVGAEVRERGKVYEEKDF